MPHSVSIHLAHPKRRILVITVYKARVELTSRHLSSSSKLLLQCGVSHHGEKEEEDLFQPKRVGSPHRQRVIDSLSSLFCSFEELGYC